MAGVVLFLAISGLSAYAFWPTITGSVGDEVDRPATERTTSQARVNVIVLAPRDFVIRAEATGHLSPWSIAEVSSQATGIVVRRLYEEGASVSQDDLLLQLEDHEQAIAVREAETDLLGAQIEYAGRTAGNLDVVHDTSEVAQARDSFERVESAHKRGLLTDAELQIERRKYDAAVLRSGFFRDEVEAVVTGLVQAEQRLDRARLFASRMQVRAPITGRVADLQTEVGERVTTGQPILSILDDSRMKVEVNVLESDLLGLRGGATARVRIPALQDSVVQGRIFAINPAVDPTTGTGRVTVSIDNRNRQLLAGLFAYVELESQRFSNRLVVPADAVLVRQGRDLVFVVKNGRAQWTYVTVGDRSGDFVEIVEPLAAGDSVAVNGHHALSHDARVEVGSVLEIEN